MPLFTKISERFIKAEQMILLRVYSKKKKWEGENKISFLIDILCMYVYVYLGSPCEALFLERERERGCFISKHFEAQLYFHFSGETCFRNDQGL